MRKRGNNDKTNHYFSVKRLHAPDCTCKIEDKLLKQQGVLDAAVNSIDDVVYVEYDDDQIALHAIKHVLHQCGYKCQGEHHDMAHHHLEHEHHKAEHHNHHAMMQQDMRRRF